MRVRAREPADLEAVERFLAGRGTLRVARLGRLERTLDHPALLAEGEGDEVAGVLTYARYRRRRVRDPAARRAGVRKSSMNTIRYEVDGSIARMTLNRPDRGNGITLEMP